MGPHFLIGAKLSGEASVVVPPPPSPLRRFLKKLKFFIFLIIHQIINQYFQLLRSIQQKKKSEKSEEADQFTPKFEWKKASEDQKLEFNDVMFRKLMMLKVPNCISNCINLKCKNETHVKEIDEYVKLLLYEIIDSGDCTVPKSKPPKKNHKDKNTPGWNSFVKPF